jgi:competence protein ComEC
MAKFTSIKLLIPFICGLILIYCFELSYWWPISLFIATLVGASAISKFPLEYQRWLLSAPVWMAILLMGFIRYEFKDRESKQIESIEIYGEHTFIGIIAEIPRKKKRLATKIQLLATDQRTYSNIDIQLYLPLENMAKINPGDTIIAKGFFSRLRPNSNPYAFDYSKYLAKSDIYIQVSGQNNYSIIPCKKLPWYKMISWGWRIDLLQRLKNIVAEDTYEISAALLLGDRSLMSDDTKEDFKDVGAIHVLAVSGLHVGIVIFLFYWILLRIPKNWQKARILMGLLCVLVLLMFSEVTGGLAPVRRAAIMFTFLLFNQIFSSRYESLNILALTALILLLIDPGAIADVGFQLSFAAVTSIICFYPLFYKSIYLKITS